MESVDPWTNQVSCQRINIFVSKLGNNINSNGFCWRIEWSNIYKVLGAQWEINYCFKYIYISVFFIIKITNFFIWTNEIKFTRKIRITFSSATRTVLTIWSTFFNRFCMYFIYICILTNLNYAWEILNRGNGADLT